MYKRIKTSNLLDKSTLTQSHNLKFLRLVIYSKVINSCVTQKALCAFDCEPCSQDISCYIPVVGIYLKYIPLVYLDLRCQSDMYVHINYVHIYCVQINYIICIGATNYPKIVQDDTESPVEDETALTEVFDKTSVDDTHKENKNELQLQLPQVSSDIANM